MASAHQGSDLCREILVFVNLPAGELDDDGKGILSEASRLANSLGTNWSVLCFADAEDAALAAMAPYGVDRVTLMTGPEQLGDSLALQGEAIAMVAREKGAGLVLLPHNDLGEVLAPQLAAQLDAALFSEAIATRREGDSLVLTRHLLGAQVAENRVWRGDAPLILTIHPRILSSVVLPNIPTGKLQLEHWKPVVASSAGGAQILERIPADPQTVDVAEAEVMISAGLGCDSHGMALVEELSRLLNASLGVTRPAYDLGYAGFERMVGQTGKTVAPRFYLALGISGSMHHIGGMKDSKRVVSVNIDDKAPIVSNSDEGFVADLREVLPLLIERVKSATGGEA